MKSKTVIYVGGTFDLFHYGHVNIFKFAKTKANYVVASINGDEFAKFYGKNPICNELERLQVVQACKYVDIAFIMEEHCLQQTYIEIFQPKYILHGNDWVGESLVQQLGITEEFLQKNNIEIIYAPYTVGISSSNIKERIIQQHSCQSQN